MHYNNTEEPLYSLSIKNLPEAVIPCDTNRMYTNICQRPNFTSVH